MENHTPIQDSLPESFIAPESLPQLDHVASTWLRLLALMIDGAVSGAIMLSLSSLDFQKLLNQESQIITWPRFALIIILVLIYDIVPLKIKGGSLGKLVLGLKVISVQGPRKELTWTQAILRVVPLRILTLVVESALQAVAFFFEDRRQFADWVASTRVVQDRPRPKPPKKRYILGTVIILYSVFAGGMQFGRMLKTIEITREGILYKVSTDSLGQ